MHTIWIHHESPLFHKPTEIPEYIPLFIYKQKDKPTPVAPTDIYWRRKKINRDHCWHHIPWLSQNGLKRSCVCHPFTYGQFATACALSTFGGDNGRVVVRRPHGGRTITCHYLPLLCDLTRKKNLLLNLRSLAITLVIAEVPYVCRTFTYVYLRSLAITCRNHS